LLLLASCFRFVSSLAPKTSPPNTNKPSHYLCNTTVPSSFNSWSTGDFMDLGGVELSPSMAHTEVSLPFNPWKMTATIDEGEPT
jgi:hypothetical protein